MTIITVSLVSLYAAANAWLAVLVRRTPAISGMFALAATLLGVAALAGSTPALLLGLAAASAAPVLVGLRLNGHVTPSHHLLRGLVACGIVALWLTTG